MSRQTKGYIMPYKLDDSYYCSQYLLTIPGVMQLESKRFSEGKVSPLEIACFSLSSASRADLTNQIVQPQLQFYNYHIMT